MDTKFEFAVSAGEGTLLAYGSDVDAVADIFESLAEKTKEPPEGLTIIIGVAPTNCETGK